MKDIVDLPGLDVANDTEAVRYMLTAEYKSHGDLPAEVKQAVTATIDGQEVARFDVPRQLGTFTFSADLTPHIATGRKTRVELATNVYNFEIFGGQVETSAKVRLRIGRRQLFRANYATDIDHRLVTDSLLISDRR